MLGEYQQHWVVAINQLAFLIDPTKLQTAADKHKLIQNCITRCGSTLSMIERILEQRAAACAVLMIVL